MMRIFFLILVSFCFVKSAFAEVKIEEVQLQKGAFSVAGCDDASQCICESDIKYPKISGLKDSAKENAINESLKKSADQVKCEGETIKNIEKQENNFSITHNYETSYQSADILALKFSDFAFEGGAHGNGTVEGAIIDIVNEKILTVNDIFNEKDFSDINLFIYNALLPDSEGIFRDEIENRKASFIKEGRCNGCTIILDKKGLNVVFQTYEVAPFSSGNPAITIPIKYVSHPAIKTAISEIEKNKTVPESDKKQ
ncbi:MAG: DUF3298 and DUF4163 domain-containing protein [Pseudomonadota bacterium]